MLAVHECKTGAEVMENVRRTKAYFNGLQPPDSERVKMLASELGAVKSERDQYRAMCCELREKLKEYENRRADSLAKPASVEKIKHVVCAHYRISFQDLCSYCRDPDILMARQVAMYLCRVLTRNSTLKIAAEFGKRDHTTVCHAEKKITALIQADPEVKSLVEILAAEIEPVIAKPVNEAA